jgi:hypothetical protein
MVHKICGTVKRDPAHWSRRRLPTRKMMLVGGETKMRGLQSQGSVIGHHMGRRMVGLAEGGPNNPVIRLRSIKPMLNQEMLLDAIDFNMDGCGVVVILH